MIARSLFRKFTLPSVVIQVGLVSAVLGNTAYSSGRTTILNYICTNYESARQFALEQSWKGPKSMPVDCRTLFQQRFELRVADIQQIIEVIPMADGRWIEIGKVRSSMGSGYSAGIVEQRLLF